MHTVEQLPHRLRIQRAGQVVTLLEAVRHVAAGGDPNAYTAVLEQCSEESKAQVKPGLSPNAQELPC